MFQTASNTATAQHGTDDERGLLYQRCRWCGTASFRRLLCPVCASSDFTPERSTGDGVVVRTSVVHRYTQDARNESLVRFPEGFVFRCRVVGAAPHLVEAGARVRPVPADEADTGDVVLELCEPPARRDWY
ncbi:Zn-ribbon domain-containing OB-fold protein [uncultured Streptomyces sp.]|uniref:Zn-ribbon domain-containing OB-fold protein n=1 Tax=uncultured Streptomyces sp. TaxID=174707 RepID=UPI0026210B32|nr:zinc ribbon domain-containing protein [uncultured Streptomyces sp.]